MFIFSKETLQRHTCLERSFKVQRSAFWSIGIDPTSEQRPLISHFRLLIPFGTLVVYLLSVLVFCVKNIKDIDKTTDALVPWLQSFLALIKVTIFWRRRKLMIPLISRLLKDIDENMDAAERNILLEENWNDIRFSSFFYVAVFCCGYSALLSPFVSGLISYYTVGEFILEPPVRAEYPLDYTSSKWYYAIQHLWLDVAVYAAIYGSTTMDTLFSFIVSNVLAQFRILAYRLDCICQKQHKDIHFNEYSECIELHLKSIQLAEQLRNVYAPIVFAKFLISCLQICCLVYQVNRQPAMGDLIFYILFLVACAVQLLLYCAHGQRISDLSDSIGYHFYKNFKVQNTSRISKQFFLLPMMRAMRACELTGVFFKVDLTLYLWVFKTAGSFITMLWTLDEK